MKREDWTGVSISLGVHVLIVLLLSLMTTAATDQTPIGFLEVEFGPIMDGRPVQQAPKTEQQVPEKFEEVEETEKQAAVSPPEVVKPVELPNASLIDADFAKDPVTRKSVGGKVHALRSCLAAYSSKGDKLISNSTPESE